MRAEAWQHAHCETNGVRLHYVSAGRGPLVVLLHGFPEFWYSWRHQIPVLAARFRVVAPDLRGYNASDKPRGIMAYALEELTADVRGLIRALGEDRAVVIGHDWGGVIAWAFAAHYPQATERLVVMNAPHPDAFGARLARDPRQLARSWYVFFFQLPWLPERLIYHTRRFFVARALRGTAVRKDAFGDEDLARFVRAIEQRGALRAAVNYYRAALRARRPPLPPLACPVRVIWGERDVALGKALTLGLGRYVTGPLEVRYLPDCGHWVQQECPEQVNALLLEFLSDQRGR